MRSPQDARALLHAIGINCEIGDDVFELICESNPTVKAFVAGDLTIQEAIFVESYLSNGFNAARAARAASYNATTATAFSNLGTAVLKKEKIRKLVARRIAEKTLTADEVLANWAEIATADMSDFVTVAMVNHPLHDEPVAVAVPDLAKAAERGRLHLVKKAKMDINGNFTFELRDQDAALNQIARHLGMFEKDNTLNIPRGLIDLLNASPEQRKKSLDEYRELLEEEE